MLKSTKKETTKVEPKETKAEEPKVEKKKPAPKKETKDGIEVSMKGGSAKVTFTVNGCKENAETRPEKNRVFAHIDKAIDTLKRKDLFDKLFK